MPATGTQLIERTRRFMGDWGPVRALAASASSSDTTLTVGATASDFFYDNQIIQIGTEAIRVADVPTSTTLTVRRGQMGTTAAAHVNAAEIIVSPRFVDLEYLDALNYGIQSTWPWIYRPVIDDSSITIAQDTYEYEIPGGTVQNILSDVHSGFEGGVGSWTASGSNTMAESIEKQYQGLSSMKCTYQDNAVYGSLTVDAPAPGAYVYGAWVYIPAAHAGTDTVIRPAGFGNAAGTYESLDMTKTDQWQYVETHVYVPSDDLQGQLTFGEVGTAPTAGDFIYVDNVVFGPVSRQMRHLARVEVKPVGDFEWYERRRWSVRRGQFIGTGALTSGGLTPSSVLVLRTLEAANTKVRLSGFGPFPDLVDTTDNLDPLYPDEAIHPLVEFAAAHLLESGEARRVAQDRGLADTREQANRVGASMQASQALLNRFERRLQAVGMPPMNGYPHVSPHP